MLESEPPLNPDWPQTPLDVWRRLGPLDLNEVHENNPIDLSQDLNYQEGEWNDSVEFGQFKENKPHGICRIVYTKEEIYVN